MNRKKSYQKNAISNPCKNWHGRNGQYSWVVRKRKPSSERAATNHGVCELATTLFVHTGPIHWRKCIDAILYLTIFFGRQFLSTRGKFVSCGVRLIQHSLSQEKHEKKIFSPCLSYSVRVVCVVCSFFGLVKGFSIYFHEWEPPVERNITHFSPNVFRRSITTCHFSKTLTIEPQPANNEHRAKRNENLYDIMDLMYGNKKTHEWYRRVQKCQTHSLPNIPNTHTHTHANGSKKADEVPKWHFHKWYYKM